MSPKMKVMIPNILTLTRAVLSPVVIICAVCKNYKLALVFAIIAAITDLFDGKLARKWNTVTDTGAKLDALCDKIFSISLTICLITKFTIFIPILIFEALIGLFNLYIYKTTKICNSLIIGKIKSTVLFVTIVIGYFALFNKINNILLGFAFMTINIQVLTLISYIINYYDEIKNEEVEEAIVNDKNKTRSKIFDIEEYEKPKEKDMESDTKVLNTIKDIFKTKKR